MRQHTPGPWYVREQDDVSEGNGYVWAVKAEAHGSYIQNPGHANTEANARLMAAAPSLLTLLEEILRDYVGESSEIGKVIAAAIAKAQGAPE
jgi:hypothetical protein